MATNSDKPAHSALLSFPKRKLSPLRRACLSLGLPVDTRPQTNLARLLRKAAKLTTTAIIEYLKFSDDEQARRIVELHSVLKATERKAVTIDYLIMAASADVHHVSGVIQEWMSRLRGIESGLLASMNAPDVTRRAIEHALRPEGHKDRRLVFELARFSLDSSQPGFTSGDHQRRT